jgi:cob(I)alamin adenosyltransferase
MGFKIDKVYTRSGDAGETGLVGGERISKTSSRIEAVGAIDELNSFLGLCKEVAIDNNAEMKDVIEYLQQELFDIGAEVSTPASFSYEGQWITTDTHVETLETFCDKYGKDLPALDSFILPGGSELAARLHLARVSCRKAERRCFSLKEAEELNENVVKYLNRLSDFLFVAARKALANSGDSAPKWVKFASRKSPI